AYSDLRVCAASVPEEHRHRRHVHGLPVVTVARALVDVARDGPFIAGVVAVDSALHADKTSTQDLSQVLAFCRDWPGALLAQSVVGFADRRSESVLESASRVMFAEHDVELPEPQVWIELPG